MDSIFSHKKARKANLLIVFSGLFFNYDTLYVNIESHWVQEQYQIPEDYDPL